MEPLFYCVSATRKTWIVPAKTWIERVDLWGLFQKRGRRAAPFDR